jgi:hypothetical protein
MLELTSEDVFLDAGCGDGRVVASALRRGVRRSIGIELDVELVRAAERHTRAVLGRGGDLARSTIVQGDLSAPELCEALLAEASCLYMFLSPAGVALVSAARKRGAALRVVSCDFRLDDRHWTLTGSRRVLDLELFSYRPCER